MSDLQVPFFNEASVKSVGRFLSKWRPHRTICIGDEIDLPQLGGFNAGTIDEMVGNINDDRKQTQEVLDELVRLTLCNEDIFIQDRVMDWLEDNEWLLCEVYDKEND